MCADDTPAWDFWQTCKRVMGILDFELGVADEVGQAVGVALAGGEGVADGERRG